MCVYRAVVFTSLLYVSDSWTLYRHQVLKLDQFHLRACGKLLELNGRIGLLM